MHYRLAHFLCLRLITMIKNLLNYATYVIFALALIACQQQKQASAEVGAASKQILDKATNDINAAQALAVEQAKAVENMDAPAVKEKLVNVEHLCRQ